MEFIVGILVVAVIALLYFNWLLFKEYARLSERYENIEYFLRKRYPVRRNKSDE